PPALRIAPRGHDAARLVEQDRAPGGGRCRLAVQQKPRAFRRHHRRRIPLHPAVHAHAAGQNRRNRLRSRQKAQLGESTGKRHLSGFSAGPRAILWHLLHMRVLRFAMAALAILPLAGCFQSSTVIRVKGDGSGTIEQRLLLSEQALDQLRAFTILGGGNADNADPTAEPQARALADAIGPGVTYVSSMPVMDGKLKGRLSTYAFADVTQLRISEQPSISGGPALKAQGINTSPD